jgi:hypothetical protein
MKSAISILLTTLSIGTVIVPTATNAQTTNNDVAIETNYQTKANSRFAAYQPSPFALAYLAYQGDLKDQGIPSYRGLVDEVSFGRVTAQDLIRAAVSANRLPSQALTDRDYQAAVQLQLDGLFGDD